MYSTYALLDCLALVCGLYVLYTWLRLIIGKKLFQNSLIIPKGKTVKDCADEEEYIEYMSPVLAVTAIVTTGYGAICMANDMAKEPFLDYPWNILLLAAVLVSLVWYAARNRKAGIDFFGM